MPTRLHWPPGYPVRGTCCRGANADGRKGRNSPASVGFPTPCEETVGWCVAVWCARCFLSMLAASLEIYENIIEIDSFHKHGFLPTMGYSKAFDCLDSDLSCSLLRARGWPPRLVNLLEAIWSRQERFVQWDLRTEAGSLDASRVQPQGDSWGPLLMSLCCGCKRGFKLC